MPKYGVQLDLKPVSYEELVNDYMSVESLELQIKDKDAIKTIIIYLLNYLQTLLENILYFIQHV